MPRTLAAAQERAWFVDAFAGRPVASRAWRVTLHGRVDTDRLDAAVCAVLARHPVLRTGVASVDGRLQAVVAQPPERGALALRDLRTVPRADRAAAADEADAADAREPLDVAASHVLRCTLLTLADDEHRLLLTGHAVAVDRQSLPLILADVARAYDAPDGSRGPSAPVWTAGDGSAAPLDPGTAEAWRAAVADLPPLELPTDRVRPLQADYAGARVSRRLGIRLADVEDLARCCSTDAGTVLRAAFHALLHRYTAQDTVLVGVDGRPPAAGPGAPGPVATTVIHRSDLKTSTTFTELLGQTARPPADPASLEQVIAAVEPARDPSRSPLYQASVTVASPDVPDRLGSAAVTGARFVGSGAVLQDLDLWIVPGEDDLLVEAEYRTTLFDEETVDGLLRHYGCLLRDALTGPDRPVATLSLMDETERRKVTEEFNDTTVPYPRDATVQQLFEDQVLRSPDAVAVTFEGRHLSYRELNERANRLAYYLRAQGVGRGTLVGLCLERSLERFLVAVLAVIKAGGAYVPLDPAYPAERLAFIAADTRTPVVVTEEKHCDTLAEPPGRVVVLEREQDDIDRCSGEDPDHTNTADDVAYIVYTSGSTGRPKGVVTTHRGVVGLVIGTDILALDTGTSYLQISPLSFDASTLEIFGPLLNGGRVVLLPPGVPTPARVATTVREQGVNTVWLVAPLFNLTVETQLEAMSGLRQFMAGGDALSIPHVRTVRERFPEIDLVNGYGPTEVTAFSVSHHIGEVDPDWPSVPIGRPMHNTTAYVVDERLEPVPVGVWGELLLGGPRVALGYHNRPELNAERFLPDPFVPAAGAQVYRTGDRVRWLRDGTLQFASRLDTQVKIDGIRVELGEIQSLLAEHPAVGACVVSARDIGGRRSLVAHVVPAEGTAFDPDQLRAHLRRSLPLVMVPGHWVEMDSIPLTPNNKVDFRALPEPVTVQGSAHRPPRTETEAALAEIWARTLGVERIGLDDNFFALGGHSLRAVPMIAAVSTRFGVDLAVQDVFETADLAELAARVEERMIAAIPADELAALLDDLPDSRTGPAS
ncbi:amino acid adenylation domain-containing protein [Streptomyces griseoincarnatus]